ncbi:cytosolic glyoxalase II [Plasmodium brasilianum]|uniref:hydroxyacylglutathione hydrolase n=2 Tax=Plasmodium (Plasmodium) TaxID=418103 RepID=A0A1D3JIL2_PLAMA|nr:cytosolic glyoxalase II, putative [Plasmodium malariae]KAI4840648.1 cytosolic glyoxalase II [Plasmodium brasilianum]SBT86212.1 cytosolic glyoxalase II, putative [Plasmodium malariae]
MKASAQVLVIPSLHDNFAYVVIDEKTKKAACVDPVEPEKILRKIEHLGVDLEYVLCTHHHYDHSGGNIRMKELRKKIKVVGSAYEATPGVSEKVYDSQIIRLGDLCIKAIHAPCHTRGHIMYYVYRTDENKNEDYNYDPILFTGDTLFIAGCGRFFEGSAREMFKNIEKVKTLRKETLIYCGHEYTLNNLRFALSIEKDNEHMINTMKEVEEKIKNKNHSVPSTIEKENLINPFFRTHQYTNKFNTNDEIQILDKLRELKNDF